jgi:site-specific DNA recombinase
MRAAIYSRYSTDQQREASIADQIEVCRRYCERQGWTVTASYDDAAISGASSRMRPGFQRLLAETESGRFDVLVCEAIDRLGRKLADVADLYDRLTFARVQIHAAAIGQVSQMHIGIMGTMAQMTLSDMRDKVRRGQLGRARAGRIPGGLAYGYEVVPPPPGAKESGERKIKPDEAEVVLRIFKSYAAGMSPRQLARELNAEGVAGPDGRPWIDTTIRGQADRGTGLLNNTLYIGKLSWNRCSYVKDPRTGRRVARINPQSEWQETAVPELRIVDQELWQRVKAQQADARIEMGRDDGGNALNRVHRRQFLLSGLLTCGSCGGAYTIVARDRYGCATRRGKGTCDNRQTIMRHRIETRVLGALKARMLTPELVEEFVRAFAEELATLQRDAGCRRDHLASQLAATDRRLQGVLRAIEDGAWSDTLRARLQDLERRKHEMTTAPAALEHPPPVRLHPNAAAIYAVKVAELEASLNAPEIRAEAANVLRSLIERVVLVDDAAAPDGLRAELHGDLATILLLAAPAEQAGRRPGGRKETPQGTCVPGGQLSVVAGIGFEPMTFRL